MQPEIDKEKNNNLNKSKEFKPESGIFSVVNGYLILIDIVDSTKRKKQYIELNQHWVNHLQFFYGNFSDFSSNLIKKLELINKKTRVKNFINKNVVFKLIGDMGFLFLPFKQGRTFF